MTVITVEDSGCGIKEEDVKALFKLFGRPNQNQKENKHGIGLGLSICKNIVERLKGTIGVESSFGFGTKFTVRIPTELEEEKEEEDINI